MSNNNNNQNIIISGGISETVRNNNYNAQDLAPNNYLTIIWKDTATKSSTTMLKELISTETSIQIQQELTNTIESAVSNNKLPYRGQNDFINIEAIAKYLAQNTIDDSTKRRVLNVLIEIASGGTSRLPNELINVCLNVFGTIADKTARKLGFSDPTRIFSQVAGQNVINILGTLGDNIQDFLDEHFKKNNDKIEQNTAQNTIASKNTEIKTQEYAGLLLGLTTSDTESYEITIPRKKVENGSDYTTHLLPQPFKKEFNVKLTNKVLTSDYNQTTEINAIEFTKNKLIEIAKSHTLFDIYIKLNNDKIYKKTNVCFSSLSFTKDEDSGNSYTASFTIEPVNSFKTKILLSSKKYKAVKSGSGTGTGSKGKRSRGGSSGLPSITNNGKKQKISYSYWQTNKLLGTANSISELQKKYPAYYVVETNNKNFKYQLKLRASCSWCYDSKMNKVFTTNTYTQTVTKQNYSSLYYGGLLSNKQINFFTSKNNNYKPIKILRRRENLKILNGGVLVNNKFWFRVIGQSKYSTTSIYSRKR